MAKAQVFPLFDKVTGTAQYVVSCTKTNKCAIIDSVLDYTPESGKTNTDNADQLIAYVKENSLDVQWILETHAHADHITASAYLKKQFPQAKIGIGSGIVIVQEVFKGLFNLGDEFVPNGSQFDHLFKEEETFKIGELEVLVISTPGHTPACISYYIKEDCIFVGDTIFMPDQGTARCDFPKGSVENLWASIHKILSLPEQTRIFTCHDYQPGGRQPAWETTVAEERKRNIHVKDGTDKEQFVKWRTERDSTLGAPKLIIPSIQVNINGGYFPKPESNGTSYLKVPVNVLAKGKGDYTQIGRAHV